jgi:nucleotide-binding universal stress UspA family protein
VARRRRRLAALRLWDHPLALSPTGITYHVLESPDPAAAILEYAVTNQVDHIIVGARKFQPAALSGQRVFARGRGSALRGDGRQSELSGAALAIIRKSAF